MVREMKKIKVIKFHDIDTDYDYNISIVDQTDWVTVSIEEFNLLKDGLYKLNTKDVKFKLVEELDYNNIKTSIDWIRRELAELDRQEKERIAKNQAKYEKSRRTAAENKKKKELKILEELKKKYKDVEGPETSVYT